MKWDDLNKRRQWWLTGFIALKMWNQWALVMICALVTTAAFYYPMLQIRELYGNIASAIFYFTMTPAPKFAGLRSDPIQQVYQ